MVPITPPAIPLSVVCSPIFTILNGRTSCPIGINCPSSFRLTSTMTGLSESIYTMQVGNDRARLLQYLLRLRSKKSTREYVKVSYQSLQLAAKADVLQPCIHRYLSNHIRTRLVKISMDEWENVASLPLAQWKKGNKS